MLISLTVPINSVNGPSMTRTLWPFEKLILAFGFSVSFVTCFRMVLISCSCRGTGRVPDPTKLVTPGVLRTTYHASSVSYTHLRAHETRHDLVCRLLLE